MAGDIEQTSGTLCHGVPCPTLPRNAESADTNIVARKERPTSPNVAPPCQIKQEMETSIGSQPKRTMPETAQNCQAKQEKSSTTFIISTRTSSMANSNPYGSSASSSRQSDFEVPSAVAKTKEEPLNDTPVVHLSNEQPYPPQTKDNKQNIATPIIRGAQTNASSNPGLHPRNVVGAISDDHIRSLIAEESLLKNEMAIERAMAVLIDLKIPLQDVNGSEEALDLNQQMDSLQQQSNFPRTVIGIVGDTGTGKSSVTNALLDEERVLPTSSMRACTAVITEVAWNHSDDPFQRYRAEIEFISRDQWLQDLELAFHDLIGTNNELVPDSLHSGTEAGVAYAKLKAVYPQETRTKEMISQCDPKALVDTPLMQGVLGTTRKIGSPTAQDLLRQLQPYVDSGEKQSGKQAHRDAQSAEKRTELWPLIKVVKIYLKSPVLSSGAVLVDLPGVQDSNAARSAIADKYIQECRSILIVAPILRAVDDKTASTLLGSSFKRRLKMDGSYSNVTFICSKTDDISVEEVKSKIDGGRIANAARQFEECQQAIRQKNAELKSAHRDIGSLKGNLKNMQKEFSIWTRLREEVLKGKTVYAPRPKSNKRKRPTKDDMGRKHQGVTEPAGNTDEGGEGVPSEVLTEEVVDKRWSDVRSQGLEIKAELADREKLLPRTECELKKLEAHSATLQDDLLVACIKGRNEYSRGAIQWHFACGLKELDDEDENEDAHNSADLNPDKNVRDYSEVARSLPVFCVSSRGYQTLYGRIGGDTAARGYSTPEDTEIPQLRQHILQLAEKIRLGACKRFLNEFLRLLNSMMLWATGRSENDSSKLALSDEEREYEMAYMKGQLQNAEKSFADTVINGNNSLRRILIKSVCAKFEKGGEKAISKAVKIARGWGLPKAEGGLPYATYQGTVRRGGIFQGTGGLRNFNEELHAPLEKAIQGGWERAFERRIPKELEEWSKAAAVLLRGLHESLKKRLKFESCTSTSPTLLDQQLDSYIRNMSETSLLARAQVTTFQRNANRGFVAEITEAMIPAYNEAKEEKGKGCFARMKAKVETHVENIRIEMFLRAVDQVEERLHDMCIEIESFMVKKFKEVLKNLKTDYTNLIMDSKEAKSTKAARRYITKLLHGADKQFEPIILASEVEVQRGAAARHGQPIADADQDEDLGSESDGTSSLDGEFGGFGGAFETD